MDPRTPGQETEPKARLELKGDEASEATAESPPTVPRLALVAGVVIAAVVALTLSIQDDNPGPGTTARAQPERGVACPHLYDASQHLEAGNEAAFTDSVKSGARMALQSLDKSGQTFGTPEETAIRLRNLLQEGNDERSHELLGAAQQACTSLDRWG